MQARISVSRVAHGSLRVSIVYGDTDPKLIWRGLGRSLDRRYPPDSAAPDPIMTLLEKLRQRDAEMEARARGRAMSRSA